MSDSWTSFLLPVFVALSFAAGIWETRNRRPAWRTWFYLVLVTALGFVGYVVKRGEAEEQAARAQKIRDISDRLKVPPSGAHSR